MRGLTAFYTDKGKETDKQNKENVIGAIVDKQAGHTAYIMGLIYI